MKKLIAVLLVLPLCLGAQVNVGNKAKSQPGQLAQCETLIAGKSELGTDPTNQAKNQAFIDLKDPEGATTWIVFDDTSIPTDLCTGVNQCPTQAIALCGLKNLNAERIRLTYDSETGEPTWCRFDCVPPNQAAEFWVYMECPAP